MFADEPREGQDTEGASEETRDLDILIEDLEPDHDSQKEISGGATKGQGGCKTGLE
jgi:hypothetical protein